MADPISDMTPAPPGAAAPQLVVGLGASAGGIQALSDFFARMSTEEPFAYVVVLHLSPDYESRLAEVLQARTRLPVTQVRGDVVLEQRHVYVIPPNENLQIADGRLTLSPMTRVEHRKAPVDLFFRSLAEEHGSAAVAIVLSGTGHDGSSGLKRVKEHGGLTIAQTPEDAEYGDMPGAAIATGVVDYVVPVAEIPERIVRYHHRLSQLASDTDGAREGEDAGALRELMRLVRVRTGHDFGNYKLATVRRRVERRISVRGVDSVADYVRLLRDHPEEALALMKELLISVTEFFRDPTAFAALEHTIIPRLFEGRSSMDQVRVWTAGCATGEEAYSIGMLLLEAAAGRMDPPSVQVFATDLDEAAIGVARDGQYSEADVVDVSPERLQRFFQRDKRGYRVRRELRDIVLFAHHNVIQDPPFSHLDLVACRNLLIYLNRSVQERVLETFHFALRPGGHLFLGGSEIPDGSRDVFAAADKDAHIFQSRSIASRMPLPTIESHASEIAMPSLLRPLERRLAERISAGELHFRLLEQFAPPSLIVTEEHTVVHMSEHVGKFLVVGGGEPSRNLFKLTHPDLRTDVRNALYAAAESLRPVRVDAARMTGRDGDVVVSMTVKPALSDNAPRRGYFLIEFDEHAATPALPARLHLASSDVSALVPLDEELVRMRDQLRATIEQYETQVEEGKAANEELQAMNEELRSAAEELETSKEELESVNEELTTVNQELKIKIDELALRNNDFSNLIQASELGAIFLDRELRVKLSTSRVQEVFSLLPSDAGRKLSDITTRLLYPALHDNVAQVLQQLHTIEREVPTADGHWYFVRIVPYRTMDDRIEGVALTFQDITGRRAAEQRVRRREERLQLVVESAVDYAIFTITDEGTIDSWNSGAERVFGYQPAEIAGRNVDILFTPEDRAAGAPERELETARSDGRAEDERWHLRKDGSRFYSSGVTTSLGKGQGFAKIARDLTVQWETEAALQEVRSGLEERVQVRTAELESEVARRGEAQLRVTTLLRKVVTAQEEERTRIARDLHDQLGQQLTALRLSLQRHRDRCTASSAQEEIDRALAIAGELDSAVDFLAFELRPSALDHLGLAATLTRFSSDWSTHSGVAAQFRAQAYRNGMLSPEAEIVFYRIAQEALNNVLKHAHAARVDILLEAREDSVVMLIEDDGIGFDPADRQVLERGIGLAGMRERAALIGAALEIESGAGKGTTIFVRCTPVAATLDEHV
jgi:two-component system, chemotaxis family, CheB/CheR fusion protein